MLAAQREWLARRSSRDEVDVRTNRAKVQISHIALTERPPSDGGVAVGLIFANGFARVHVPINNELMLEPGPLDAHSKPAGPYE